MHSAAKSNPEKSELTIIDEKLAEGPRKWPPEVYYRAPSSTLLANHPSYRIRRNLRDAWLGIHSTLTATRRSWNLGKSEIQFSNRTFNNFVWRVYTAFDSCIYGRSYSTYEGFCWIGHDGYGVIFITIEELEYIAFLPLGSNCGIVWIGCQNLYHN